MQRTARITGLLLGLIALSANAIENRNVWVSEISTGAGSVALFNGDQTEAVQHSIVQRWAGEQVSGTRLSEWRTSADQGLYVLQVPVGVDRFTQGQLELNNLEQASVFLNGQRLQANGDSYSLTLTTGDHQLLVLAHSENGLSDVELNWTGANDHDVVTTERPDSYRLNPEQIYDAPTTTQLSLSPDGQHMVWKRQHFTAATGDTPQVRLQLMELASERAVFEWTDVRANHFAWLDNGRQLAYISNNRIYRLDIDSINIEPLTPELEGLGALRWLDDQTLLFGWNKSPQGNDKLTKRYRALEDRWSYFRNNSQLYTLNTESRVISQLTQAPVTTTLLDVNPAGDHILVSRRQVDYAEPPHFATRLLEIDLSTGEERTVGDYRTFNQALYSSRGIYVVAGPAFADGAGINLPADMTTNNYDGQLYHMDRDGEQVQPLTRDFAPAVGGIVKTASDDLILSVTERDGTQLYHYQAGQQRLAKLNNELEVIEQFTVSLEETPRIAFAGTAATAPQRVYHQSLQQANPQLWWDSAQQAYKLNQFRGVREWNFNNERGDTIYGRVYLPHNFDENESYPALVYYYGGTTPVQRAFTGRYPFNLWADMGYVVYVLQPTGTIGFGQEFSAMHVNAWGEYTTDDIIEGTRRFLEEHPFVDSERVGNLGASYGGFMTMLLATKTDMFAASMSHAGISTLTSYWGQGWWGFLYSGEASKGSFPWNNPELYTQHSPVYRADKINTPMLLIHGDADTNVPPGESQTMYTALKLLGKDVELVEFLGEDHAINSRTARLKWWQTYMAYFDMKLKDEPEWWEHLFPEN